MFGISVSKGKHTIFEIASDSKIIFPSSDSCVILSGITLGLILNTQSTHMQSLFWISVDITYSKNFNLEWCLELGEGGGGGGGEGRVDFLWCYKNSFLEFFLFDIYAFKILVHPVQDLNILYHRVPL